MERRDEKNIYTYYKGFNGDLIDCVYSAAAAPPIKKIFAKNGENI